MAHSLQCIAKPFHCEIGFVYIKVVTRQIWQIWKKRWLLIFLPVLDRSWDLNCTTFHVGSVTFGVTFNIPPITLVIWQAAHIRSIHAWLYIEDMYRTLSLWHICAPCWVNASDMWYSGREITRYITHCSTISNLLNVHTSSWCFLMILTTFPSPLRQYVYECKLILLAIFLLSFGLYRGSTENNIKLCYFEKGRSYLCITFNDVA